MYSSRPKAHGCAFWPWTRNVNRTLVEPLDPNEVKFWVWVRMVFEMVSIPGYGHTQWLGWSLAKFPQDRRKLLGMQRKTLKLLHVLQFLLREQPRIWSANVITCASSVKLEGKGHCNIFPLLVYRSHDLWVIWLDRPLVVTTTWHTFLFQIHSSLDPFP